MKRFTALLVMTVMVFSLCITASARVTIPISTKSATFGDYSTHSAQQLVWGQKLAHYFETTDPLKKYTSVCPSYSDNKGQMTISIYQWAGTYDDTIAGTAIASETFVDFNDGATLEVAVTGGKYTGAFLTVFSGASLLNKVGVWRIKEVDEGVVSNIYINGTLYENETFESKVYTGENIDVSGVERTARDAYTRIQAEDYDYASTSITKADTSIYVATTNTATGFADINFGSTSPKGLNVRIYPGSVSCGDTGEIHIMLDDPEYGTKIAEVYFEYKDQIPEWITIPCNISTTITGTHDLYMVFYGMYYRIDWFQFTKVAAGLSYYDERLANFVPVDDSSLVYNYSDTWSATDMMGRKLPGYETAGERDPERQVGIFYWTWHAQPGYLQKGTVHNNEATLKRYLRKNPGGTEADIKNLWGWTNADGTTDGWGSSADGPFWWNESVYGYYNGMDSWVMRKHLELLSAAGVDSLFFDTTNGNRTFTGGYMSIAKTIHEMRQTGMKTPQMSFILQFSSNQNTTEDLRRLYQSMYGTGLYSDTWYYWDGKPVIMGHPSYLDVDTGFEDINALNAVIKDFFTFRPAQPSYFTGQVYDVHWPWLEVAPQHGFMPLTDSKYNYEAVSVGVAQNANAAQGLTAMNGEDVYGRIYTYKNQHTLLSEESKFYGYNFAEQWERAYELNPKFVFITGWNEWTAGHYTEWMGVKCAFPDQYRDEYSRDIEPTKGDFKDNYYYQMVAGIRKFKGVSPTPVASAEKTIRIGGAFSQWDAVGPEFIGYQGGTDTRAFYGQRYIEYYYNDTGRNDIVLSKVARDADNLYFYVKTNEALTSYTDPSWMRLFINTDRTYKTGWEGYDFAVNIDTPASTTSTTLSYSADGWNWKDVGTLTYKYSGNQMMIRIPRDMLGLTDKVVDIEFKWNDNMQNQGDIMDVYNNGDTAPIGRFAYRYTETTDYDTTPVDEPVTVSELKVNQHKHSVIMAIDKNTAFAGGKQVTLDVAPQLINEKTMIPLRFFSESFGAEVDWNDETKTAIIELDGNTVEITVNKSEMLVNGEAVALESPAVISGGRTLVPMRDLAENLGKEVLWIDGGLIIAGENPETVHSYEWVGDMTEDNYGIR